MSVALYLPGRGKGNPDLPLPHDLALEVVPVGAAAPAKLVRDVQDATNAMAPHANVKRLVWTLDVPRAGEYRITARGSFQGIGIDQQLWLGHGPPLPGTAVPLVAAALAALGFLVVLVVVPALRGRNRTSTDPNHA